MILYENHVLLRYYTHHDNPDLVILKADSDLLGKEVFNRNEVTIIGKLVGKYTKY